MSKSARWWCLSSLMALLFLIISGCNRFINTGWAESDFTPIEAISASPEAKIVKIQGIVTQSAPLLNSFAYEVADDTGTIWVLANPPETPAVGAEVTVEGLLQFEEIVIDGQDFSTIYLDTTNDD